MRSQSVLVRIEMLKMNDGSDPLSTKKTLFTPRDSVLGRYKRGGEELRGVWQVEQTAGFIFIHSMCLFSSPVRN